MAAAFSAEKFVLQLAKQHRFKTINLIHSAAGINHLETSEATKLST
jgi:hypothetical protein